MVGKEFPHLTALSETSPGRPRYEGYGTVATGRGLPGAEGFGLGGVVSRRLGLTTAAHDPLVSGPADHAGCQGYDVIHDGSAMPSLQVPSLCGVSYAWSVLHAADGDGAVVSWWLVEQWPEHTSGAYASAYRSGTGRCVNVTQGHHRETVAEPTDVSATPCDTLQP
jgi:hypothetical protein